MYKADYKPPTGPTIKIEFEHDFDGDSLVISQAKNLSDNSTLFDLQVLYLIYDSIQELVAV